MSNIIYFYKRKKGDNMCRELITKLRSGDKSIEDMPKRAQDILGYFKINRQCTEIPIVDILNDIGFKIFQTELEPKGLSAYIAIDPQYEEMYDSNKITCVNLTDSIGHKRFALAHELAHYLFDFDEQHVLYYYNTYFSKENSDSPEEERANKFAANLLMPENIFREKYNECKGMPSKADIVSTLGKTFMVSPTAILKRFKELNIEGYDLI